MTIESLLQKQTDASKISNLILALIAEKKKEDPVLKIVRTWGSIKTNQPKIMNFARAEPINLISITLKPSSLIDTDILCFIETCNGTDMIGTKICAPLTCSYPYSI